MKKYKTNNQSTSNNLLNHALKILPALVFSATCHGTSTGEMSFSSKHHDFSVKTILSNLDKPWGLAFVNPNLALITLKNGEILRFDLKENVITKLCQLH